MELINLALNRDSLLRCDKILCSSTLMTCLVASPETSLHLWEFTQRHIPAILRHLILQNICRKFYVLKEVWAAIMP